MEINIRKLTDRKSINAKLKKFCPSAEDDDYIEIVESLKGEGIDVIINRKNFDRMFSLNYDELDAIKYLTMTLNYNYNEKL